MEQLIKPKTKRERRGARGARKVKTGCLTCKIRHKKCDERSPACSQCTSTGRKCDLVAVLPGPRLHHPTPLIDPTDVDADADLSLRSLPTGLWGSTASTTGLDVLDVWHFEYFRVVCAAQLSLVLGIPGVWETLILRAAFTERCILQGVLALGALSRNVVPRNPSVPSSRRKPTLFPGCPSGYSWHKYSLAIREMNGRLGGVNASSEDGSGWELAVLGSLIFIAIEAIQGDEDVARMHLRGALAIWESSQEASSTYLTPESRGAMGRVIDAFSRLDFQSRLRSLGQGGLLLPLQRPILPPCFLSIEAARDSLNAILGAFNFLTWRRSFLLEHQIQVQHNQSESSLRLSLPQEISALSHLLDSWLALFTVYKSHRPLSDAKTTTCTPILLIQYHILQINLSSLSPSPFSPSEIDYNRHVSRFSSIIDLGHLILEAQRESYPAPIRTQPGSNFHVAVVQPLFFAACKCRDALLRRRAIEALEKVTGTSSEHSRLLASVARWVVQMEEGRSFSPVPSGVSAAVREEAMLSDVEVDISDAIGGCRVTAWKKRRNGEWHGIFRYIDA